MPFTVSALINIKSLFLGEIGCITEMPFTEETGGIAVGFQRFGNGNFFKRQLMFIIGRKQFPFLFSADPVGYVQPGRIFTAHNTGPRG